VAPVLVQRRLARPKPGVAPHVYAGSAAYFNGLSSRQAVVSSATLNIGVNGFTIAVWVQLGSVPTTGAVVEHYGTANGWSMYHSEPNHLSTLYLVNAVGQSNNTQAIAVTGTDWHLWMGDWDGANNGTGTWAIDNGTQYSTTSIGVLSPLLVPFTVCGKGFNGGTSGTQFNAAVDSLGYWNRVLSNTERGYLWNGGLGLAYYDLVNSYPSLLSGLCNWYDCDDQGGQDLVDASGAGLTLLGQNGTSTYTSVPGVR